MPPFAPVPFFLVLFFWVWLVSGQVPPGRAGQQHPEQQRGWAGRAPPGSEDARSYFPHTLRREFRSRFAKWRADAPSKAIHSLSPSTPVPTKGQRVVVILQPYPQEIMLAHLKEDLRSLRREFTIMPPTAANRHARDAFKIYISFEEPNQPILKPGESFEEGFNRTMLRGSHWLTLCPYSAKWWNENVPKVVRTPVYYPISEDLAPKLIPPEGKTCGVTFVGDKLGPLGSLLTDIRHFHYRWMSFKKKQAGDMATTHVGLSLEAKLRALSECRISVVYNFIPYPAPSRLAQSFHDNPRRMSHIGLWEPMHNSTAALERGYHIVPQLKARTMEAALSGTVMLVARDPFNIIEEYFTPGDHFVYFDGPDDLGAKVLEILKNYEIYWPMAERARSRVLRRFTTRHFARDFILPFVDASNPR